MGGGKNVCEAVVHTVNLSAYKTAQRAAPPLSKCLLIAPCKTTRLPPCTNKNMPAIPHCPPCEPLKLCNPIEAQYVCKTESCVCRPKRPPMTTTERLAYTFGFALKCGVIVGLIWVTNEQGVWSGHHEITCLYGRIMRRVKCYTGLDVAPKPGEYPEVPHIGSVTGQITDYWNSAMAGLFNTILFVPRFIGTYFTSDEQPSKDAPKEKTGVVVKKSMCM